MDRNFAKALELVLKHEGGWSDHPSDPGGATMKGITIATFRRHVNAKATKDDLRNITAAEVAKVYRHQYWAAIKGDDLPDGIDYAVFDFAVNSGPGRAAKYLQTALGVTSDGKIGPATIASAKAAFKAGTITRLCDRRMEFLRGLKTWPDFGKGWSRRVADVQKVALDMAGEAAMGRPAPKPVSAPQPVPVPVPPVAAKRPSTALTVIAVAIISGVTVFFDKISNWIMGFFQ